uniref:Protein spinster 1 n=1 Tax=Ascaris suum TaxID=6253 RepID=F1L095_ASCSU
MDDSSSHVQTDCTSNVSEVTSESNASITGSGTTKTVKAARMTLRGCISMFLLFLINLLNYTDRFTLAGVLTDIQKYFNLDDAKIGLLQTVFVIFYMLSALICGFLGDRYNRKWLVIFGITLWVSAVFASSFVPEKFYYLFLSCRGALGFGEACYVTIVPSIIADMFVGNTRARALMFFYFAAPLGSGFGYIFGSYTNSLLNGWKWALRLTPIFSAICLILFASIIREPGRGEAETATGAAAANQIETTSYWNDIVALLQIRTYVLATIAYTAVVFSMMSLSWWGPTSMCYAFAMNHDFNSTDDIDKQTKAEINFFFGLITIIGGLAGVVVGSLWAQMWSGGKYCFRAVRTKRANALVCAIGSCMGAPLLFFGLRFMDGNMAVAWIFIFFTVTAMCLNFSINVELCLDVVTPTRRNVANGLQMFISNLLGGAVGPYTVGIVSDAIRGSDDRPTARFKGVLRAFYIINCVLLISGLCYFLAAFFFTGDHTNFRKKMGYADASRTDDFSLSHSNKEQT